MCTEIQNPPPVWQAFGANAPDTRENLTGMTHEVKVECFECKVCKIIGERERSLTGINHKWSSIEPSENKINNSDKNLNEEFEAQLGAELVPDLTSTLSVISNVTRMKIDDKMITELEGIIALCVALEGTTSFTSVIGVFGLYLRKFIDKSITKQTLEYLQEMFITPQEGKEDVDTIAQKSNDWVAMMRSLNSNWKSVKNNHFFKHLSKLLGLVVSLEMCKASSLTFDIGKYKFIEPDMSMIHVDAFDLVDAALSSISFFVEVGMLCWTSKSLKPLLLNDISSMALDEEFANIVLCWELVRNGNLMKIRGMSENEFDKRLEDLTTKLRDLQHSLSGFDKRLVVDKFVKLLRIKNDYITLKISSGVRKAPYVIELNGESSQGKTTAGEQFVKGMLQSAGLPTGKEYQASYNAADKFMSNWSTNKLVMTIDDMANDKSQFVERPPTRVIIDVCNNQPFYANMADLDSKGKIFVEPALVVVTTNVKDLDSRVYSNCPYSIQRRMNVIITVKAKKEFQFCDEEGNPCGIDSSKVAASYAHLPEKPLFDDIWTFTLERALAPAKLSSTGSYGVIVSDGVRMENVDFKTALNYLIREFNTHLQSQQAIVDRMLERERVLSLCGVDGCNQIKGYCCQHPLKPQLGVESSLFYSSLRAVLAKHLFDRVANRIGVAENVATKQLVKSARRYARRWDWIMLVPTPLVSNDVIIRAHMLYSYYNVRRWYVLLTMILWTVYLFTALFIFENSYTKPIGRISAAVAFYPFFCCQKSIVSFISVFYRRKLVKLNAINPMFRELRDAHISSLCKACAFIGVLYAFSKVYRAWRGLSVQSPLQPEDESDVEKRDAQKNVWTTITRRELPTNPSTANTTSVQLEGLVRKNLVYGSVETATGKYAVNALFLRSNVFIMPQHYFKYGDDMEVVFYKADPDTSGGKFASRISRIKSYFVPGTDLALCYSATGGSFKDLTKYLPLEPYDEVEFSLLYREKTGAMLEARGLGKRCNTGHTDCKFDGILYSSLSIDTRPGLCGATLVARRKPLLLGFHLGGKEGTPRGCAGILYQSQALTALESLRQYESIVLTGSAEQFETQVLGVAVLTNKDLHPKSPMRYLPDNSQLEWYGTCVGASTFASNVKVTLVSEHVTDIMGSPNIYRPPVVNPQWYGWQTCLANMANPAKSFPTATLDWAVRDYKSSLLDIFSSKMWKHTTPLNDLENWNGVPGKKFLDRIKLNTAVGYPLTGKKSKYVCEVLAVDPYSKIVEPTRIIQDEIERLQSCYQRGERAFPIAKACKKDEVVSKEKCRIFYGTSTAMTFMVRRYFLPILRVLQLYPLVSECAVGINSFGPEWQELHDHVFKHGKERLFGGDYGKYDQKLPSQILIATYRVMIDFAKACSYSATDIQIMESLVGDVVYAIIAFNGDLVGITSGSHISGIPVTVHSNGIGGSLNLRCFYHDTFKDRSAVLKPFREVVSLMTYGDDNIGSVAPGYEDFNIKAASHYLAHYGQVYTMPNKTDELVPFLRSDEFEFLKRKSVYHEKLGVHLGALSEASCFKMLHCYVRDRSSPITEEHACALNIETASREWFNHGEEIYEARRRELQMVSERAGLSYLTNELNLSYDDRVDIWRKDYDPCVREER